MDNSQDEKLRVFFKNKKKLLFKKGETVLSASFQPLGAYFLEEGYIKDSVISDSGQEFTLFIFKPGDVFPYNFVFNNIPNAHSFQAMTACTVFICPQDSFLKFIKSNPDVLFMMMQRILVRLRGIMIRMEHLVFGTAEAKIASIFSILSERFGEKKSKGIKILIPLSHKDIAELVGITRETASIEIQKLEKKEIIKRTGKFYMVFKPVELLAISVHKPI